MSTDTDFDVAPFYDDFDPTKGYYRVLFRPGVPVQARELTQSQTILQNQIQTFGENIFQDGTIVSGCAFTLNNAVPYVKVLDLQVDGEPVNISEFANTVMVNSANLYASVINTADGLESQNPNLNTLYVKYTNASTNGTKNFQYNDVLTAYSNNFALQSIAIANNGTGYSNTDTVVFAPANGAAAVIVTDNYGAIANVVITSGGGGYLIPPTISLANSTGGTSNGSGASLVANSVIAQLTVAGNTFLNGKNIDYSPTGLSYTMSVAEGEIFQKGFFLYVQPQSIIVSKYDSYPNNISVGFVTEEMVVNNNVDTSLLDNAQGTPNYSAPGAYRLQLTPTLTSMLANTAASANTFLPLATFQNGQPVRTNQTTQYGQIGAEMALRTSETSGNFVTSPFNIITNDIWGNTSFFQTRVSAGEAYVNGYRINQLNTISLPERKGTDTAQILGNGISVTYSNYLLVENFQGLFPFNALPTVQLCSAPSTGVTAAAGTVLGTAQLRSVVYDNGTPGDPACEYRLYLFNIQMTNGASFADVESVFYNGGGAPNNGSATIVQTSNVTSLTEPSFLTTIYPVGRKAVMTLRNTTGNNNISYIWSTVDQGLSFSAAGTLQKTLTGSDTFPFSGLLDSSEEEEFIFVAQNSANSATPANGTVALVAGSNNVIGTATSFLNNYSVGDHIMFATGEYHRVTNIANNTSLFVDSNIITANSSCNSYKYFPANTPIAFQGRANRSITVAAAGVGLTAQLEVGLSNVLNVTGIYNLKRQGANQLDKNFNSSVAVKINTSTHPAGTNGPWCLGIPDALGIVQVLQTTSNDYLTNNVDVTSNFAVTSGQKDTHYGLSHLQITPGSKYTLPANSYLTVYVASFSSVSTGGGIGFFSIDSYPVNDSATANTQATIKTQAIPIFTSPSSGSAYDLRDSLDLRPVCLATATVTSNAAAATINPANTETFSAGEHYLPAPNQLFTTDFQYYQGRYDKLSLSSLGVFSIIEGTAADNPVPPSDVTGAMTLASIAVPPYPTLTTISGKSRPDYQVKVTTSQTRNYTMADIGALDDRIQQLQYYTSLSLLEQQTASLNIPSSTDPSLNRFMNGIFVDPFHDFSIGNVQDPEWTAAIDTVNSELIPRFDQGKFDLMIKSNNGVQVTGDLVTLPYSSVSATNQPYASRVYNCSANFYEYRGNLTLTPTYDNYVDTRVNPENTMNINIDDASSVLSLVSQLNNIYAINNPQVTSTTTTSNNLVSSVNWTQTNGSVWNTSNYQGTSTTQTTTTSTQINANVVTNTQQVGDFVTNVSFSPYVNEQIIFFQAYGMRPSAPLWAFFDQIDVTAFVQPCTFNANVYSNTSANTESAWMPYGQLGQGLRADANGQVFGMFYLPPNTFFCGSNVLLLMDIDSISSQSASTTSASQTFNAYNFTVDESPLTVSTRTATLSLGTSSTITSTTTRSTSSTSTQVSAPPPPPSKPPSGPKQPFKPENPAEGGIGELDSWWWWGYANSAPLTDGDGLTNPDSWGDVGDGESDDGGDGYSDGYGDGGSDSGSGDGGSGPVTGDGEGDYGGGGGGAPDGGIDLMDYDPIAQSFLISTDMTYNQEGLYVTAIDLYFQQADPNLGVTVQLRQMSNGLPTGTILPFASKHLTANEVSVSNNASVATKVTFESPVFLAAGQEFCVTVAPDGNSPNYLLYCADVGGTDLTTPSITISSAWADGMMFTSTNNQTWSPIQGSNFKFTLYRANFTAASGTLTLVNKDIEQFSWNTMYPTAGANGATYVYQGCIQGEWAFNYNPKYILNGNVSFSTNSSVVTGYGTNFLTSLNAGHRIVVSNTAILSGANLANIPLLFDTFEIASVANNTSLTLSGSPKFGANNVVALNAPTGKVYLNDESNQRIFLTSSSAANSSFQFGANDQMVGVVTGTVMAANSITDQIFSYFQPLVYRTTVTGTTITATATMMNTAYALQPAIPIQLNNTNYVTNFEPILASHTNEINNGGNKSFTMSLTLTSNSSIVSPTVDLQSVSVLWYKNLINDDDTGEVGPNGNCVSRYVSKTIVLADGQDAEDIQAYLTAYRPPGTDTEIYVRLLNASDPDSLANKAWTKLAIQGDDTWSDPSNRSSLIEYQFSFNDVPDTTTLSGVGSGTANSNILTGSNTSFTTQLAVGDVIQVVNDFDSYIVGQVLNIANNTQLTMSEPLPWNALGAQINAFINPGEAYRDQSNNGVITYYTASGQYATYQTYAIKIDLLAQSPSLVPRCDNIRAIALSV